MSAIIQTPCRLAIKACKRQGWRSPQPALRESEVMGNYHASFGERDGETRTVRIVKVRTVPTPLSPILSNVYMDRFDVAILFRTHGDVRHR